MVGKKFCPCCLCCRHWSRVEERVAQEYLHEAADRLACGTKRCSWCSACYDRRCIKASYIIFIILMVAALFITNIGVLGILPYSKTATFLPTTCTVVRATYTGDTYKCGNSQCPTNISCSTYPCLAMYVTYDTPDGITESEKSTILYDTQWELYGKGESKKCTIQPYHCASNSYPTKTIAEFVSQFQVNSTLSCLYNPLDLGQVIRHRTKPRIFSLAVVGACGLLFIIGLVGLLVTALSCGCKCKVLCSGRPPNSIRKRLKAQGACSARY